MVSRGVWGPSLKCPHLFPLGTGTWWSMFSTGTHLQIRHSVYSSDTVCVLSKERWFVEYLSLPHVHVEDHNEEENSVVEPLALWMKKPYFVQGIRQAIKNNKLLDSGCCVPFSYWPKPSAKVEQIENIWHKSYPDSSTVCNLELGKR